MVVNLVKKMFGSRNERVVRRHQKAVQKINALEPAFQKLSDEQLRAKTAEFKQRLQQGESLDALLPEAFAAVREAAVRTLEMRHFDVQLIGGMVLHNGNIAEMLTGEGKTLGATLPAYLNALTERGVHIVTVNDYLAERDANWMRPIYEFLGMTVGINLTTMAHEEKQQAYRADITYGTNNEYGFDYLRDNMAFQLDQRVQRDLYFAIVDEVDSILIDEARTPLIISGASEESSELYQKVDQLIPHLTLRETEEGEGDYYLDEENKQVHLTEQGHETVERLLAEMNLLREGGGLYDAANIILMHHVLAALRAHKLFQRDVEYIVKDDQIIIVDEHTGRLMPGRRWSEGLHQAVEAKEKVNIQSENQTLASITFQNYFRNYEKLAGMTGTADTEAYEFHEIYSLEVIVLPPNRKVVRKDYPDKVYVTASDKFKAIVAEIKECQQRGQPVLVGTTSIETSEFLSKLLTQENIQHSVLNAKQHAREAQIIAEAGRPGTVTLATNMAGRGTDIVLGGNLKVEIEALENPTEEAIEQCRIAWQKAHEQVIAAGGLHVLGTERHESRRIDNQLRGRSGRQGDPGSSCFYLSLEDNLLRIFASDRIAALIGRLGVMSEAMEHPMLSRVIENAQRKVEGHNFDVRKQLLEYDDIANEQRKVIYAQRTQVMMSEDISKTIAAMFEEVAKDVVERYVPPESFLEQWNLPGLEQHLREEFDIDFPVQQWLDSDQQVEEETVRTRVYDALLQRYQDKVQQLGAPLMRQLEKTILLQTLDMHWKDHLAMMDHLRQGINLRSYAQKNPKQEYKRDAFELFASMLNSLRHRVVSMLSMVQVEAPSDVEILEAQRQQAMSQPMQFQHGEFDESQRIATEESVAVRDVTQPLMRNQPKIGRNDACYCGSGRKYKYCHGQIS